MQDELVQNGTESNTLELSRYGRVRRVTVCKITVKEAAFLIGISKNSVYKLLKTKRLKTVKAISTKRVLLSSVKTLLRDEYSLDELRKLLINSGL